MMTIKINIYKLIVATTILFAVLATGTAEAEAQIDIEVNREFTLSKQGVMTVTETESLTNRFDDRFLPGGSARDYFFVISAQDPDDRQRVADAIYNSTSVALNGEAIDFEKIRQGDNYGVRYFLRTRLNPSERQNILIRYIHPELGEKVGGLLDAYIPAFSEEFQFELNNTNYTYRTTLRIPEGVGDENIVSVEPLSKFNENGFDVYVFNQDSLIGKFVWVQRGSQQVYDFKISQTVLPTDEFDTGNVNEYKMVIPRDINEVKVRQTVYLTNIEPEPYAVTVDNEGNILGIFRLPAHEQREIVIEGYALLENKGESSLTPAGSLDMIDQNRFSKYLQPAEFWEVYNEQIEAEARSIVGNEGDVFDILTEVYVSVIDSIDYSQVKRFGLNERRGALATLNGGSAVCMEYSDLYLTLLRNRGVPARAVFGYGYDSRLPADSQEPHQWVQAYLPEQANWISVDVTWGESGPQVIGGDLNHFYTHVAAVDPNTPSVLSRLAVGQVDAELLGPELEINVLAELPEEIEDNSSSIAQLLEEYPNTDSSDRDYYVTVLRSKYSATLNNLVTNPNRIDTQGWFLLAATALILLVFVSVAIKVSKKGAELIKTKRGKSNGSGMLAS
jgi:transglutaminase-like putative cysteine protease